MSASRQAIRGKAAQAQQLVDGAVAELAKWTEAGLLRPEHAAFAHLRLSLSMTNVRISLSQTCYGSPCSTNLRRV